MSNTEVDGLGQHITKANDKGEMQRITKVVVTREHRTEPGVLIELDITEQLIPPGDGTRTDDQLDTDDHNDGITIALAIYLIKLSVHAAHPVRIDIETEEGDYV